MLENPKKTAAVFFVGLIAVETIWQIYKRLRRSNNKTKLKTINEVIIFSEELAACRLHAVSRISCSRINCSVKTMRKLAAYLETSNRSLDVCMYLFSCEDLARAITRSFNRGVIVRIIIDGGMAENSACDRRIREFQEQGIKVRMKKSEYLMHHKFAIIDRELILTGSTNWTMQALHGNWDNVIISNEEALVEPFVTEFDRMWAKLTEGEDWRETILNSWFVLL